MLLSHVVVSYCCCCCLMLLSHVVVSCCCLMLLSFHVLESLFCCCFTVLLFYFVAGFRECMSHRFALIFWWQSLRIRLSGKDQDMLLAMVQEREKLRQEVPHLTALLWQMTDQLHGRGLPTLWYCFVTFLGESVLAS